MKPFPTSLILLSFLVPAALAQSSRPSDGPPPAILAPMTVTGTRESAPLTETPAAIGIISAASIRETAPMHPAQLLSQIPGVAVAVTNGEGHTTAIRQPFTTSPVYLFLEDGIPIRATGFFNHNALYEVNVPMAGRVEVIRGPGTALHGSDAIGGVVNILTRAPTATPLATLTAEGGSFGTWRFLGAAGGAASDHGAYGVNLNLTHTDGWRNHTGYDRQSANVRVDQSLGRGVTIKSVLAVSKIDQQTGANSPLTYADYLDHPTRNLLPIAFRQVSAVRASVEYEQVFDSAAISLIPYFRDNAMDLNGSYNLNSDPRIEQTHNVSYGLMAKGRQNLPFWRARLIGGVDFDSSAGSRQEDNLLVTRSGTGANTLFSDYARGTRIYDYRVTFQSLSPYVHVEFSPLARLRVTAGLRHDTLRFALRNHLAPGTVSAVVLGATRYYGQIARDDARFAHTSPKLGATYALNAHTHLYASYHFGFRAPSESQLYRAGNDAGAANAVAKAQLARALKPIQARQFELGVRGDHGGWTYDLVAYDLTKQDDLVSQRNLATNVATSVNAGETEHRGVEAAIGADLGYKLRLGTALSYSRQRYVRWVTSTANFNGKDIEAAPKVMANTRLTWRPTKAAMLQLEWIRIGAYWLEPGNSPAFGRYPGHDLINLRGSYRLSPHLSVSARVMNLADKRYAESASIASNTPVFSPGLPRAGYVAIEYNW
ncbi:TonB-dependent receptor [Opitutus sp. ER46]|uniref:TonB-dependent receptor n=1 Tax=Opitutus sp. ER46 TaxID=2161864 RepID=UPI000D2FDB03|nr:TonB-dependent receptor [Opitutus sp. ER46]PTY00134.1 TonB-dependent receptor [Opitutus sp. ER46]